METMNLQTQSKIKGMSPQFLVTDLEHSIDFYIKKLGFTVAFRYEDFYAAIVKDGYSIHLKSGKPSGEERKRKRENKDLDVVFSVERIEELYQEFYNKAVEITQPLSDQPYGREFYIADPDGYILAFVQEL